MQIAALPLVNLTEKMRHIIAIYIHWPYCLSKCPYCDFNSHLLTEVDIKLWQNSYAQEIEYFAQEISGKYIRSIFFGGGTPSLMAPEIVENIIFKLSNIGIIDAQTEITLETNPTSYESKKFLQFQQAGINRVSIGVQSLRPEGLLKLGRQHSADEAKEVIRQAAAIFENVSFDLIYARSNQTFYEWQDELKDALALAKGHISLYQLTIEKGTPFYQQYHRGDFTLPSDNVTADMYEWTTGYLKQHKYDRYEISNYAKPGSESKHNLAYWQYQSFIGIGPGAHSRLHKQSNDHIQVHSIMMTHKPVNWLNSVREKGNGIQYDKILTKEEITSEIFMMGLRLQEGLNSDMLYKLTGQNIFETINMKIAESYSDNGFLNFNEHNINLTDKGLMLHNYILARLIDF